MDFSTEQLRTLAAVLDAGTLDAGARALNVTPSAISQRLKAMENQLGRLLLIRSKPLRPTESGMVVLRLARQVELLQREAAAALTPESNTLTRIPVVVNADSLATWFLTAVAGLDSVALEIVSDDQAHSVDLLRHGSVMAAVTSVEEPVQGCWSTLIGGMTYRATASPTYLQRWMPEGVSSTSLARAPFVVFNHKDALQQDYLLARGVDPSAPPRHFVPGSADFLHAVELGMGWGMLPDEQAAPGIARGDLVQLTGGAPLHVPLYWQQWALESVALRAVATAAAAGAPGRPAR